MRRRWPSIESASGCAVLAIALILGGCRGDPAPKIVDDAAGLLSEEQRAHVQGLHELLREDHDLDYRVELVRGVGDLDAYANRRFAELAVGSRSRNARGLLLVLDANQDLVRVEVGRGLEGAFPDAFVAYLELRQMVPYFRASRVGDGVLAATELLVTRIQNAETRAAWDAEPWARGSAGGGARTRARLGSGPDPSFSRGPEVAAGVSPEETVRAYLAAMARRNGRPDLDLYSRGSRAMLGDRVMTPAQMDNVARTYRACGRQTSRIDGSRAVLRYPAEARHCAPFLLVREAGAWRLDFETAARAIRFGRSNAWRWEEDQAGPYAFGFADWRFDRHGFPRIGGEESATP